MARHCTDCGVVLGCDAETTMGEGGDRFCEACAAEHDAESDAG